MSGPTQRPSGHESKAWEASPALAWTVRVAIVALPVLVAWLTVRLVSGFFYRPDGTIGLVLWILQAVVAGSLVSLLTERFTRRFVPLAALLNMSLVFPDESPSRFGTALKSGTVRKRQKQLAQIQAEGLSTSETEAAEEAIHLVTMLGQHDRLTRGHTERVRAYSDLIAQEMGLPQEDRDKLAWGSMLHDVGKMMVPAEILNKNGKPTKEEWAILQDHPAAGVDLLAPLANWLGPWVLAASEHHERWDGTGYPLGLAGTQVSIAGRITAVADAYDVMTSRRSYKAPMPAEEAREELVQASGTQFDPNVVRALLNVSVGKKVRFGPLAWLAELPGVANGAAAIPSAVATTGVVAGSMAVGALAIAPLPETLAFDVVATTVVVTTSEPVSTLPELSPTTSPSSTTTRATSSTSTETSTTTVDIAGSTTSQLPQSATTTSAPAAQPTTTTTQATTTTTQATTTTSETHGLVVANDSLTLEENKDKRINILDNDLDGGSGFDLGTLEITIEPTHSPSYRVHNDHIHYKAEKDYEGSDFLEYRICNNAGGCLTGRLDITVTD